MVNMADKNALKSAKIWFISYITNTHFFHGNIWTHKWPAPNVSGFIAQLEEHRTGIARSRVQTPLKYWIFFQAFLRNCINCVHCDDHFFIFKDANFDHDLLKTAEEIAPQSHRILQTFVWRGWASLFPPPPLPHHTHVCKISRLCGETIFVRF